MLAVTVQVQLGGLSHQFPPHTQPGSSLAAMMSHGPRPGLARRYGEHRACPTVTVRLLVGESRLSHGPSQWPAAG